ncbi:unnamed protein product, partial [Discosporangium mesarthrocarpum]
LQGYRNKCEFTLGYNDKGVPTAGFRGSGFQAGRAVLVEPPNGCPQVVRVRVR